MKKVFFLTIFFTTLIFAQTEERSVELPDFVITGKQSVDVQTATKKKPELISIVSQDFLTPRYSPEELPLLISVEPKLVIPSVDNLDNSYFGNLNVGLGRYTYPTGELNLNKSIDYYLLHANVWGTNIKEYFNNAGYNASSFSLDNNVFISTKSDILPGSLIKLSGEYFRDSYKFYGSSNPAYKRETNKGLGNFTFSNTYNKWFNFGINFKAQLLTMKESNLKEKILENSGFLETKLNKITFGGKGFYQKQLLENNLSGNDDFNFYLIEGYTKIYSFRDIVLILGVDYANNSTTSFFSPIGSLEMKLSKGLTLKSEFKPYAKNFTVTDFLDKNLYMVNDSIDNVFTKVNFNISVSVKYEYEKSFSINFWGYYNKAKNYLYFEDTKQDGFFNVLTSNDVKSISAGIDLIIFPNDYGYLNCELKVQKVKDTNDRFIPYTPVYNSSITYGYNFPFGLGIKTSYKFMSNYYADINNKRSILDYHDISVSLTYNIFESLSLKADFQNIINRSNFVLDGYKEKPFDVILGVVYRWQ